MPQEDSLRSTVQVLKEWVNYNLPEMQKSNDGGRWVALGVLLDESFD